MINTSKESKVFFSLFVGWRINYSEIVGMMRKGTTTWEADRELVAHIRIIKFIYAGLIFVH